MLLKIRCILLFSCLNYIGGHATKAIDMDYFLSFLRNNSCSTKEGLENCKELCREVPVVCHNGECYCHQSIVEIIKPQNLVASVDFRIEPKAPVVPKNEVQINITPQFVPKSDEDVQVYMVMDDILHPVRRHQIAHFCPSLDVARKCIRKCISLGKAAFCGKDHKCYCGHRYSSHDKQDNQDALEIYKEFSDMYAKYLGNPGRHYPHSNENDDDLNGPIALKQVIKKN